MRTERTARLLDLSQPLRLDVEALKQFRFYVASPDGQYEPLARQRLRVLLGEEDLSGRVAAFDQEAGTVTLYVTVETVGTVGKITRWDIDPETGKPRLETRTGDVILSYRYANGATYVGGLSGEQIRARYPSRRAAPVGGTFTLDMAGRKSEPLPFDAPASMVQAAFARLSAEGAAEARTAEVPVTDNGPCRLSRLSGYYYPELEELDAMPRELGIGDSQWCELSGPTCADALLRLAEEVRAGRLRVAELREETSSLLLRESTITFKIRPG